MGKLKVIVVEPNKQARAAEIENSLEAMQKAVGGYIQAIYPYDDNVAIVCNEEGKIDGLPLNRALRDDDGKIYDVIAGTFFVAGLTEDDFGSISGKQEEIYLEKFKTPETFARFDNKIFAIPIEETAKERSISI